jgi:NAD(P)-dependent dehydrogenase (short-subunit alcohol dehydrogenase family)
MQRLQNKTAIVTGAAHGIGKAIAEVFAEHGAHVFIADIDNAAGEMLAGEIRARSGHAVFFPCDVSSKEAVADVVQRTAALTKRIDILCNNAAYLSRTWHAAGDALDEEWEKSFRVSLLGAQHFTQETLPYMLPHKSGSIINVSSIQGLVAGRSSVAYTSIKHALIGFTRSVAYDYGPQNIRCNAICPGAIKTRISPEPGSELHQRQISKTFLGRTGTPREVANAALFLASEESSYVTGAVLSVDGGWTAM